MKKYFSVLLILFSLLVWVAPAQAATVPADFMIWSQQTTTDIHKTWTVKFSAAMDLDTMNNSNIYVTDDSNLSVKTTLIGSTDGNSVQVSPVTAYTLGKKYWLFMTGDITKNNGEQKLASPVAMPFTVSNFISVEGIYSSLLTSFTVVTGPEVCSVKINQNEMLYKGDNVFALGMTGLKQGSNVTVYAYDSGGKLLEKQIYTVN